MWIDFTRRNDPACAAGLTLLRAALNAAKVLPSVLCYWTKNALGLASIHGDIIKKMKDRGILVLAQTTINCGYTKIEPGIKSEFWNLGNLITLLGSPLHLRGRFDPVIIGYTTINMFINHCKILKEFGITRTTVNFCVPSYKDAKSALASVGINARAATKEEMISLFTQYIQIAREYGVSVQCCAETAGMVNYVPGLLVAACADANWPGTVTGKSYDFNNRASRPGCGCCYSADWGKYMSQGGYRCPHGCKYCYAK